MVDVDLLTRPPQHASGYCRLDKDDSAPHPHPAPARPPKHASDKIERDPRDMASRPSDGPDAIASRVNHSIKTAQDPRTRVHYLAASGSHSVSSGAAALESRDGQRQAPSSSNSQDTYSTDGADDIFTPPPGGDAVPSSGAHGNGQDSSQESQLLQLSEVAAVQEKMPDVDASHSRKRMADGVVKQHARHGSAASPVYHGGHSRNTSTVSIPSTAGSRIEELSAELKARLSYAMVKVNNGWHSHTIDQVESLAPQGVSPTSSTSTLHGRHATSASPQLALAMSHRGSNGTTPASATNYQFPPPNDVSRRDMVLTKASPPLASPLAASRTAPSLAPPISIEPARPTANARRNSNPRYAPAFLSHSHNASPHTPAQLSPLPGVTYQHMMGTPVADPILFSPHQNVREQDAIESLLFMSSPGNSANLKHAFPAPSSQPLPSTRNGASVTSSPHRTALPGSQPRKSLPTARPSHHSQPTRRVGFEGSPGSLNEMDVDEQFGTPHATTSSYSRGTPRRRVNNGHPAQDPLPRLKVPLSMPAGLSGSSRPRPIGEEDIEKMIDRVAADDSSDSDGEIQIPARPNGGAGAPGR